MPADVAGDFPATGRMAHVDGVRQIERLDERRQIVRVGVHLVAIPRLTRSAVAAPIVCDASVAARREKDHLVFPGVSAERPPMAEDDGLSAAPVLVIDLRAVACGDRGRRAVAGSYSRHRLFS